MSNQGNITYQKLWNTAKTTLRGEFMAIGAYIRKSKGLKINEWSMVYVSNLSTTVVINQPAQS